MAFVIAVPGFLIPYAFVFDQGILLQGDVWHILRVLVTAAIGVLALSAATGGYVLGPLSWLLRVALFGFAPLLIDPNAATDMIGASGIALVLGYQVWRYKLSGRTKPSVATPGS
jgi:TRAP-type uncharacterized transport system fused permease subunit